MTQQSKALRVALIGFGEVGTTLAVGLIAGGAQLVAYDKGYQTPPFAELLQRRSRELGIRLVPSIAEVVAGADLILAMVPGGAAYEAASEAAAVLKAGQIYADLGTASPPVKEKISQLLEPTGAAFVDVAIMGALPQDKHRVPTLVSGKEAARYCEMVKPFEMKAEVAGDRPGRAAAIKMFRSILMKGFEALVFEALLAARTWDVTDTVMESVSQSMGSRPFYPDWTSHFVRGGAIHAARRAHEMDMVMETMNDVGVEPRMTRATAAMLHWVADMGLREQYGGVTPTDWQEVMGEIEKRAEK
jgi:3-hydroxyisobutyrate dehydrogenase-like beta-hydroxyacid dehydrogenase